MFGRLFGKRKKQAEPVEEYDEAAEQEWDEKKSEYMESVLGKEHDMVMHAIIPYAVGGGLDLYYYPHGIPGTGVGTKELIACGGDGPSNDVYPCYELVMFTRYALNLDDAKSEDTEFGIAHSNINSVLNCIARYSSEATLNPNETCEFPSDMEVVGGKCLIFDRYSSSDDASPHGMGLMLIMEIHRSEMEYAMENGGGNLIVMLKDKGYYPYSDLDREPVV